MGLSERPGAAAWPSAILCALAILTLAPQAQGAAGFPDPGFGTEGFTILSEPAVPHERLEDVVVLSSGKILAAGFRGGSSGFLLARFDANGSPDTSFDGDGIQVTPDDGETGDPREIAGIELLSNGSLVAAGLGRGATENAFGFARYLPGGALDTEFGDEGVATVELGSSASANAVDVSSDQKVVAAGESITGEVPVVRLTSAGVPDEGFGDDPEGIRFVDIPGSSEEVARAVQVLAGGAVLTGGFSSVGPFLAMLDSSGNPVGGFGGSGIGVYAIADGATPFGSIEDLAVLSDGDLLATGYATALAGDHQLFVARFESNGELDPGFSEDGIFFANPTPNGDQGLALAVQPDGKILAAGLRNQVPELSGETWLVRLTPKGELDASFGSGGEAFDDVVPGIESAAGLALQPDGRSVIAGAASETGGFQLLVGRFTGDPAPPAGGAGSTGPATPPPPPPSPRRFCQGQPATIVGSPGPDRIVGTRRADTIVALGGDDLVFARPGRDVVCAGAGRDEARGGAGRDLLLGGAGRDLLLGGSGGPDRCDGGSGRRDRAPRGCEQLLGVP